MLEKLEMFKRTPKIKGLVGEMLMLEDLLKLTFWNVGQQIDLIILKHSRFNSRDKSLSNCSMAYSRYLLRQLLKKKSYFSLNDEVEEKIVFYME